MSDWMTAREDWLSFFARYPRIVLVANSDAVDMTALVETHGDEALYVFFNKAYKVLETPFAGRALLVARSSAAGANIVYRNEVADVLSLFGGGLVGIAGLKVGVDERFSPASAFGGARAGEIDLADAFASFYPASHVPTSGFALAVWLAETCSAPVFLAGFTARRSIRWKLFADHDWTFEQVVLRLLHRTGYVSMDMVDPFNPYLEMRRRFPGIEASDIAATGVEVLSNRMEVANTAIDRLFSLNRIPARIDGFFRRLKPKTRKQKLKDAVAQPR